MLQSTVSLLNNISAVGNSQYLKKILRIPEDQLRILNNIPGWTSEADASKLSPSCTSEINKDNQQTLSITPTPASTVCQKDLEVVDSKETEKHFENTNRKKRFRLRKTSSLDSVSIRKTNSTQTLKRSSSTSNIKEKTTFENTSFDTSNFSLGKRVVVSEKSSLSNIEEVVEMQVDMDRHSFEKSQFSNSGVQCKMSQDPNLELDAFQPPSLSSSNFPLKRETLKLLNAFSPTNQTHEREKIVEKSNVSESKNNCLADADVLLKESLNEKSKIDMMNVDESCISLPVPCAQPPSENIHPDKELVSDQKESASSRNNYYSSTSKGMQSSSENTNFHLSGKRKRKSRQEKSKKHKGVNADHIKIEYSSEQIKNMIELMRVLNKY